MNELTRNRTALPLEMFSKCFCSPTINTTPAQSNYPENKRRRFSQTGASLSWKAMVVDSVSEVHELWRWGGLGVLSLFLRSYIAAQLWRRWIKSSTLSPKLAGHPIRWKIPSLTIDWIFPSAGFPNLSSQCESYEIFLDKGLRLKEESGSAYR